MKMVKPIASEFSPIKTAFKTGRQMAKQNNKGFVKSVGKGITQVYKHTGVLPLVTGTVTGVGLLGIPGSTISGVLAGVFLKKGLKNLVNLVKKNKIG